VAVAVTGMSDCKCVVCCLGVIKRLHMEEKNALVECGEIVASFVGERGLATGHHGLGILVCRRWR
jgi:hypothetical protein